MMLAKETDNMLRNAAKCQQNRKNLSSSQTFGSKELIIWKKEQI